MTELTFIIIIILLYTIAGYPLLQWALAQFKPKTVNKIKTAEPASVIVCVRNEVNHIQNRIKNILSMQYPPDLLEIIIVSDGSVDGTNEAVESYGDSRVRLITLASPSGKAVALNAGVKAAKHDFLIFGDARQAFKPDVAQRLMSYLSPAIHTISTT